MTLLLGYVEAAGAADPVATSTNCPRPYSSGIPRITRAELTLPQASRLFSIELAGCERVFDALVREGFLASDGRAFRNAGAGGSH